MSAHIILFSFLIVGLLIYLSLNLTFQYIKLQKRKTRYMKAAGRVVNLIINGGRDALAEFNNAFLLAHPELANKFKKKLINFTKKSLKSGIPTSKLTEYFYLSSEIQKYIII